MSGDLVCALLKTLHYLIQTFLYHKWQSHDWELITLFSLPLSDGFTPLMIASCSGGGLETGNSEEEEDPSAEIISDFIYQGANLHNQTDRTGETALHLAARYARSDAAKRLLESSADANVQDNMGRTPLHAAVAADAQGVFQVTTFTYRSLIVLRALIFDYVLPAFHT